jgi:hypothetical protein
MISRSDGISFHLLLADHPLPYPNERSAATHRISVCFWYCHVSQPKTTSATIVTVRSNRNTRPAIFRLIETIADLLARDLAHVGSSATSMISGAIPYSNWLPDTRYRLVKK